MRITNRYGETPNQTYQKGCKKSEKTLWMKEFMNTETHTRVLLMNHLWNLREVWIWVSRVLKLTSRKTEIARGLKLQGHRAEDVLVESNLVQKICDLIQRILKLLVKDVNLETIIDMQSWCKTWLHNGSSRIRAKHKLLRKPKSSWSRIGNLKSFTLTISWNLARPVKIFPGIIVRQHHTDQKQMGLLREQCAE